MADLNINLVLRILLAMILAVGMSRAQAPTPISITGAASGFESCMYDTHKDGPLFRYSGGEMPLNDTGPEDCYKKCQMQVRHLGTLIQACNAKCRVG